MQTINLIEPADGWVSHLLQKHHLPKQNPDAENSSAVSGFQWNNLEVVNADRSHPHPITFSWERIGRRWSTLSYDLVIAPTPYFDTDVMITGGISKPTMDIGHLLLGTRYYWKVVARKGDNVIAESPVRALDTDATPPRWLRVPGITNVRDLGGWPLPNGKRIRQGMAFRSSEMNGHLRITDRGRKIMEDFLKIRTDLDLRGEFDGASPALDPDKVTWINAPISPYDCVADITFRAEYLKIFKLFADPDRYPILFHCVGGADRGGTVALLLNALLGKERELLIHDYELTTLSVWGERSRWSEQFKALLDALRGYHDDPDDINAQAENYVKSIGLSDAELQSIRDLLITSS
ncbi:MAG: protein-tyrosine phosphatase [Candidatus Promineifilaceae bacterium]|jgi:protein-tyrosine phosphatase